MALPLRGAKCDLVGERWLRAHTDHKPKQMSPVLQDTRPQDSPGEQEQPAADVGRMYPQLPPPIQAGEGVNGWAAIDRLSVLDCLVSPRVKHDVLRHLFAQIIAALPTLTHGHTIALKNVFYSPAQLKETHTRIP